MAIVTVLGAGMMGSALCLPLVDRGHQVRLVGTHLDEAIVNSMQRSQLHPKLGLTLPGFRTYSHREFAAAMDGTELLALGVSSAGARWAAEQIAPFARPDLPVFMITKGLENGAGGLKVLPDVVAEVVEQRSGVRIEPCAIAGPCIAGELARRVQTCVVLTGRSRALLERVQAALQCDYYHVFISLDVIGVETCAALKNAYAMGIAFSTGQYERTGGQPGSLGFHNGEAATFAQAIVEMQRLIELAGGTPASASWLPGVGDLDVTCNGGRTGRFGRLLGLGRTVEQAIAEMSGATLECLEILDVLERALPALTERGLDRRDVPLLEHMIAVARHGAPVNLPFAEFFRSHP